MDTNNLAVICVTILAAGCIVAACVTKIDFTHPIETAVAGLIGFLGGIAATKALSKPT